MGQEQSNLNNIPLSPYNLVNLSNRPAMLPGEHEFRQRQKQELIHIRSVLVRLSEIEEVIPSDTDGHLLVDTEIYTDLSRDPLSANTKTIFSPIKKAMRKTKGVIIFANFNVFTQYNAFILHELANFSNYQSKQDRIYGIINNIDDAILKLDDFYKNIF